MNHQSNKGLLGDSHAKRGTLGSGNVVARPGHASLLKLVLVASLQAQPISRAQPTAPLASGASEGEHLLAGGSQFSCRDPTFGLRRHWCGLEIIACVLRRANLQVSFAVTSQLRLCSTQRSPACSPTQTAQLVSERAPLHRQSWCPAGGRQRTAAKSCIAMASFMLTKQCKEVGLASPDKQGGPGGAADEEY